MNITIASFANGAITTTALTALWQYDYGQILKVESIELPTARKTELCIGASAVREFLFTIPCLL